MLDLMILQELSFIDFSICLLKNKCLFLISLNLLNIHGFSKAMMKKDQELLMMLTSGKVLEMTFHQFL